MRTRRMRFVAVMTMATTVSLAGQGKQEDRLRECGTVIKEILGMREGIPKDLLNRAECVIVFPSVKKFAIGVGGSYGRGAMVCRGGEHFTGPWSAPAMYALEGANIGLQLGGQATDFVMLVGNPRCGLGAEKQSEAGS